MNSFMDEEMENKATTLFNCIFNKGFKAGARYGEYQARIKELEKKRQQKEATEIKVGDEVIYDREKCVVTAIANGGYTVMLLGLGGGYMVRTTRDEIKGKRTGRRFPEIANILKQMQEGE